MYQKYSSRHHGKADGFHSLEQFYLSWHLHFLTFREWLLEACPTKELLEKSVSVPVGLLTLKFGRI